MSLSGRALTLLIASTAACSSSNEPVRVRIAPSLLFPRGLLDDVKKLTVTVYDASATVSCDPVTGIATSDPASDKPTATKELGTTCASGVKFCGEVIVEKNDKDRIFLAQGTVADKVTATGCTTAKVNQDALPLTIKMIRFVTPAVCGNDTVEATEQCEKEPEICDAECHTTEVRLSIGDASASTQTGGVGDKFEPFFLWPAGSGDPGRLFVFFTDKATVGATSANDIAVRVLSDTMKKGDLKATTPPILGTSSVNLTNGASVFPSKAAPFAQSAASAAIAGNDYFVVFQDDDSANGVDIHYRLVDGVLSLRSSGGLNGPSGAGKAGIQAAPQASANGGKILVAWQDDGDNGKIYARTVAPNGASPPTLGAESEISSGTGNTRVGIAPLSGSGWVCVWESGGDIKIRNVKENGTVDGPEQVVNDATAGVQERPRIAGLGDGRYAVVWADKGSGQSDVLFQRFDASGKKIAGDQAGPVNDVVKDGDQGFPAIAGLSSQSGSYAIAWLDAASSHVRGRFLGGSRGFLFNNVTGQTTEFQASAAASRTRANPVVVGGGSSPFVAFGWEDRTNGGTPGPGIVARRFPSP